MLDMSKGVFIVIEGTDGSGKETQSSLLVEKLRADNYDVALFDFPQYSNPSSYFVQKYLNGEYGDINATGPYTASLFFALDRFDAGKDIRQALSEGKIVIANRYVASNMAHQGTKFSNKSERKGYFIWLDNLEFSILGIPRPDMNFVLRVSADMAQQLVDKKGERAYTDKKRDLHESDINHMRKSVEVYDELCDMFPEDFERIDCVRSGKLMSIESIHALIFAKVSSILPEPNLSAQNVSPVESASAPTETSEDISLDMLEIKKDYSKHFNIPKLFDADTALTYKSALNAIYKLNAAMFASLVKHMPKEDALKAVQYSLPVATYTDDEQATYLSQTFHPLNPELKAFANSATTNTYPTPSEKIQLTTHTPRNELSVVASILYPYTDSARVEVDTAAEQLSYNEKAKIIITALQDTHQNNSAFKEVMYGFDFLDNYLQLLALQKSQQATTIARQTLTPRFGYEIPEAIETHNLTDMYEQCFDISLKLHSYLQQAGFNRESENAVLTGHRVRWQWTVSLAKLLATANTNPLFEEMVQKINTKHPLIADSILNKP